MAYNLQSLITILEQILNPEQTRWILDDHNKPQLQSLLQKALSLKKILRNSSYPKILSSFESRIREAAHEAEDLIESFMVHQMQSSRAGVSFTFLTPDLQQVMQELDSLTEQVVKLTEEMPTLSTTGNREVDEDEEAEDVIESQTDDQMLCGSVFKWLMLCFTFSSSGGASLPRDPSSRRRPLVGVDADLLQLKDRLTRTAQKKREIVPIVGMGGIGKTFLARNLYEDQLIVEHFHIRYWATISKDYDMKTFLSDLGCKIGKKFDQHTELVNLHKRLYGRRYMIVLDDMWKFKFWDKVKPYFPDDNIGSRIVITTRDSDMANYADSQSHQHRVKLLNESDSLDLLYRVVFGEEENCPHFLRAACKKIAGDCGGLPLAITVIGGLLSKVERSKHAWENVADDVKTAISQSDNERFSNILSLSYNHLLDHLKPCFLYMGAFPEDYEVKATKLVRLWIAEGFVEAKGDDKSLEEEAKNYLEALVERNLLMIKTETSNGKPKRYSIHDLLRELCIKKAEEEKFLHAGSSAFSNPRRMSVHATYGRGDAAADAANSMRSFVSIGEEIMSPYFAESRMMRVLDVKRNKFKEFPREILQLFNLRYLGVSCSSSLPTGISRLWNLQTLVAKIGPGKVPLQIWELSELRHLKLNKLVLFEDQDTRRIVERKMLQTMSMVVLNPSLIRVGFFESIPNVGNLSISCNTSDPVDLTHLIKLQTLKFESKVGSVGRHSLPGLRFPCSITKLTLIKCVIFVSVLKTLMTALPNLSMLKILKCEFKSEETDECEKWEVEEGVQFSSLQFLHLRNSKLVRWAADETNFPRLRRLFLESCFELEEIPNGIGDIATLELIELKGCSASAVESAKQIQEEQSDNGNDDLKISIL